MIVFYTAVGEYKILKDAKGNRYPVIMSEGKEHYLGKEEMLLWVSLMWHILTYNEAKKAFYQKEHDVCLLGDGLFEDYLDRLEQRGLVVSGCDYTALDALYKLVASLHLIPQNTGYLHRLGTFFSLTFKHGMPFNISKKLLVSQKLSQTQKRVIALSKKEDLSVAEVICRLENKEDCQDDLVCSPGNTMEKVIISGQFSPVRDYLIKEITNLYLRKQLVLSR